MLCHSEPPTSAHPIFNSESKHSVSKPTFGGYRHPCIPSVELNPHAHVQVGSEGMFESH